MLLRDDQHPVLCSHGGGGEELAEAHVKTLQFIYDNVVTRQSSNSSLIPMVDDVDTTEHCRGLDWLNLYIINSMA